MSSGVQGGILTKPVLVVMASVAALATLGARAARAIPVPTDSVSAQYLYEVLLDTDNNTATGGPVPVVQGMEMPHNEVGIDYIVRVGASNLTCLSGPQSPAPAPMSMGPMVYTRDVLKWNPGTSTFDVVTCDNTPYPIGEGLGGEGLVEFGTLLSLIGNPTGTIRGVFHATRNPGVDSDYTTAFLLSPPQNAPAQSPAGLALLALLLLGVAVFLVERKRPALVGKALVVGLMLMASVASAAIVIDGLFADWTGINPVVTDPSGDSSLHDDAEDILAGYAVFMGPQIFFRMDLAAPPQGVPCPP